MSSQNGGQKLNRLSALSANGSPPLQSTINETAQTALAKTAKMDIADRALMTRHLANIEEMEMQDVRNLKATHFGGLWRDQLSNENGDQMTPLTRSIIVCDDLNINTPPKEAAPAPPAPAPQPAPVAAASAAVPAARSLLWPVLAAALGAGTLGAGGAALAAWLANKPAAAQSSTDTDTDTGIGFLDPVKK